MQVNCVPVVATCRVPSIHFEGRHSSRPSSARLMHLRSIFIASTSLSTRRLVDTRIFAKSVWSPMTEIGTSRATFHPTLDSNCTGV